MTPQVAVKGSVNVLRQAEAAGITNFVYMSSITTMADLRSRIPQGGILDDQSKHARHSKYSSDK